VLTDFPSMLYGYKKVITILRTTTFNCEHVTRSAINPTRWNFQNYRHDTSRDTWRGWAGQESTSSL